MATLTERLAIVVEADASKGIAQFKQLGVAAKGLGGPVGQAGGLMQKLGGQLGGLAGAAGPAALAGVGAAIAKFALDGVSAFVDLAGRVKEFRRVAGGTAEDASRLVAAFSAVGVDATTAATGVFQLEKHLAAGADKLAAFGITAVKDARGNTDMSKTLLGVADAYQRINDPVQKAALLTAAFGRQGTALIPLLSKSREEIAAFFDEAAKSHQILSPDDLQKATEYKLAVHDLGEAFKGLEIEAGVALVPFLTSVANAATDVIHLTDTVGGFIAKVASIPAVIPGVSAKTVLGALAAAAPGLGTLAGALGSVALKANEAGSSLGSGFADELTTVAGALGLLGNTTPIDDLDKALTAATTADHALADAHVATGDAQAALNKLLNDGAVDAKKVADATRSLADANRAVGHEQRAQADAQTAYNLALAAFNVLGTDTARDKLHDATNNLADANDNLAGAQDRAKAAADALATAKAGDPDYQQHLADAIQHVADAKFTESQRALASVTAHDNETTALSDNADAVQTLIDKYKDLIAQHPEAAGALAGNQAALDKAKAAGTGTPGTPVPPLQAVPSASINSGHTTNNVTVNVNSDHPIDPTGLSRTIIWNLN